MKVDFELFLSLTIIIKYLSQDLKNILFDIIYIFFDAISRKHFSRVYKKTSQFINNFMKYEGYSNKKDPSQKYHGFQFFKQHSFREFTLGNNIPMFYGKPYYSKKIDSKANGLKIDKRYENLFSNPLHIL